jgi:hypothetical protein
MYSITQTTPHFGLDLAHAVMDEQIRRGTSSGRSRMPRSTGPRLRLPRPRVWIRRPAIAG